MDPTRALLLKACILLLKPGFDQNQELFYREAGIENTDHLLQREPRTFASHCQLANRRF